MLFCSVINSPTCDPSSITYSPSLQSYRISLQEDVLRKHVSVCNDRIMIKVNIESLQEGPLIREDCHIHPALDPINDANRACLRNTITDCVNTGYNPSRSTTRALKCVGGTDVDTVLIVILFYIYKAIFHTRGRSRLMLFVVFE